MATKLTLNIDTKVIERAKKYAKEKGISISRIVEDHLKKIISSRKRNKDNKKPSLMELKGILGKVPPDFEYKDNVYQYLKEKHK